MKKKPSDFVVEKTYDNLPMCTEEQTAAYIAKAKTFINTTHWYADCQSVAYCAIADYLASLDGVQLKRGS